MNLGGHKYKLQSKGSSASVVLMKLTFASDWRKYKITRTSQEAQVPTSRGSMAVFPEQSETVLIDLCLTPTTILGSCVLLLESNCTMWFHK